MNQFKLYFKTKWICHFSSPMFVVFRYLVKKQNIHKHEKQENLTFCNFCSSLLTSTEGLVENLEMVELDRDNLRSLCKWMEMEREFFFFSTFSDYLIFQISSFSFFPFSSILIPSLHFLSLYFTLLFSNSICPLSKCQKTQRLFNWTMSNQEVGIVQTCVYLTGKVKVLNTVQNSIVQNKTTD